MTLHRLLPISDYRLSIPHFSMILIQNLQLDSLYFAPDKKNI